MDHRLGSVPQEEDQRIVKVDLRLIRQLQVEYIGIIQKDARNDKVSDG